MQKFHLTALKRNKRPLAALLLALPLFVHFSCRKKSGHASMPVAPSAIEDNFIGVPEIRVAVKKDAHELCVRALRTGATVIDGNGTPLGKLAPSQGLHLQATSAGILIREPFQAYGKGVVRVLAASSEGSLEINGTQTGHGVSVFRPAQSKGLTIVSHINLEEYLMGVLAGEVPVNQWGAEALKAQAVASRSYALYKMKINHDKPYDVVSTVFDQVYKSGQQHPPQVRNAIAETLGLAVTENDHLIPTYFHSTCGGHTASAHETFPAQSPLKTLAGIPCPFCEASPVYRWSARINKADLERSLRNSPEGKNIKRGGRLQGFVFSRSGSGFRATKVTVRFSTGTLSIPAPRFRLIVGPGKLKSIAITKVVDRGSYFEFQGGGFGHGVGLCQFGSQGMAKEGYTYEKILGFYFPGGALTKVYSRSPSLAARN